MSSGSPRGDRVGFESTTEELRRENEGLRRRLDLMERALRAVGDGRRVASAAAEDAAPASAIATDRDVVEREQAQLALERTPNLLADAQRIAHVGSFEYVVATQTTVWSEEEYRIYGLDPAGPSPTYDDLLAARIHPDDAASLHETFTRAVQDRSIYELEHRIVRPDGEVRWVYDRAHPFFDPQGNLVRYVGATLDTTERRATEEALRQSRMDLDRAQAVGQMGWWRLDTRRNVLTWSPENHHIFGVPEGTPMSYESFLSIVHADDREHVDAQWRAGLRGEPYDIEHRIVADGKVKWVRERAYLEFDPEGRLLGGFGITQDITARKQAEEALRESEERFRTCFANASIGFVMTGPDGRFVDANPAFCATTGYSTEELREMSLSQLIHPDDRAATMTSIARMIAGEIPDFVVENRYVRKDGEVVWVRKSVSVARRADHTPRWIIKLVEDITSRKQAEAALQQLNADLERRVAVRTAEVLQASQRVAAERQWFLSVLETLPFNLMLVRPDHRVVWVNEAYRQLLGDNVGKPCFAAFGRTQPCGECQAFVPLTTGKPHNWEWTLPTGRTWDTYNFPFADSDGSPMILRMSIDVTERQQLERRLQLTGKMEAIGRLAGGVAHDFNNLLQVIIGCGTLALQDAERGEPSTSSLDQILKAADRAAALTKQLLAFSRAQPPERRLLDLSELIADREKMLRRLVREDVEIVLSTVPHLDTTSADPAQVDQVLLNLVVNAADAMPRGGRLTVATSNAELDEAYAATHPNVAPGRYVMLAVGDTGEGMTAETQARIFEPFFTTKPMGKGTGLGLSTVYGIVAQHGGHVSVHSDLGAGTTFEVYLPSVSAAADARSTEEPAAARQPATETILVVEDEPMVRESLREMLIREGYRVLIAGDGPEAFETARGHDGVIHLLVSDVVLPGLSGPEIAEQLRTERPQMRVLFLSGYADTAAARLGALREGEWLLSKPVTAEALRRRVRGLLDQPPHRD